MFAGHTVIEARGRKAVSEAVIAPVDGGDEHSFACDLVVVSGGAIPASSLLLQAGAQSAYDTGSRPLRARPAARGHATPPARWPALDGDEAAAISGELAGREAAHALGHRHRRVRRAASPSSQPS